MIDPITKAMLEEECYNSLYEAFTDPKIYGSQTASQFGIKWRAFNLATIDMSKFNNMVDKIVKVKSTKAYKAGKIAGQASGSYKGLATAVIAAAVVTIAYQGYKRFLSKAAKACKGYKGDVKTSCMNRYKKDAMRKQLSDLEHGLVSCEKTMEVYDCKDRVKAKMRKIKSKLGTL